MKEGMDKDGGNKPGMSKELAKMAAEQESIRKELKKLADQLNKEGEKGTGSSINKLAEKMEETETDLVNKIIKENKIHAISCTGNNIEESIFRLVAHNSYKDYPDYRYFTAMPIARQRCGIVGCRPCRPRQPEP